MLSRSPAGGNERWAVEHYPRRVVTKEEVVEVIEKAASGPVAEGCLGAGTGTVCFGWKGGIGTSSRTLDIQWAHWCSRILAVFYKSMEFPWGDCLVNII